MIRKYKVVIESGEDGWLVVTVPALPGCITQGKTVEEALRNAKEAIEAYLESLEKDNQPIPEPDIVSWIAKRIKGISSRELRQKFPHLKEWCPDHLWAPSCFHGSVGHGWEVVERYIDGQKRYKGGVVVTVRDSLDRLRTFVRGM
jgi:predicted RNase H-like HicB family nuclease